MQLVWAAVLLGSFLSVAEAQSPVIVTQPADEAVVAGGTASFSVAVSGAGPFTYQWQFNGTNLSYGVLSENSRIDKGWLKARPGLAWVPGCCQAAG
jgi:hypothetical protein